MSKIAPQHRKGHTATQNVAEDVVSINEVRQEMASFVVHALKNAKRDPEMVKAISGMYRELMKDLW